MPKLKNILFYSWWINFWVVILFIVAMWERPMLRFIGPMAFMAFIAYAFYAMLMTKPEPPSNGPNPPVTHTSKPSDFPKQ